MKTTKLNNTFAIGCLVQWYEVETYQYDSDQNFQMIIYNRPNKKLMTYDL